jgi:hypothetical protein
MEAQGFCVQHGIENHEELALAGNKRGLGEFTAGS